MSESSVPFRHPWPEKLFGQVGSVTVGGTPSTAVPKYWGGDIPWMASGDVHLKVIDDVPTRISELGLRHSSATMVAPPSVAVALAGQGKTRGTVALVLCELCTNQSVALLKGEPGELDTTYLLHNLAFRYTELRSRSAGGGRAGLSKQILEQVPVPLPPLPEQCKIAEVLSTVDRAIEQTEALIAKQQRIKTGLMQDLLTRGIDEHGNLRSEATHEFKDSPIGRIPAEWDALVLEKMTRADSQITYGVVQPGREDENGVLFIRGGDIYQGEINQSGLRTITRAVSESYKRTILQGGEVLMSLVGYPGEVAVVPDSLAGANIARQAALIRLADAYDPYHVMHYLLSVAGKRQVLGASLGSAQQVVNLKELRKVIVPVPRKNEQAEICRRISAAFDAHHSLVRTSAKLQAVKTGLMQDLLAGERRVTALLDPQDGVTV